MKKFLSILLAVTMLLGMMSFAVTAEAADAWDGTADTSWYNETDKEFTITTAEQLAGLAELVAGTLTFKDVTIKLANDLDLYCEDTTEYADGDPLTFRPIGDHSKGGTFEGVFDGDGHTISNLYQNGWDLGYEWGIYGSYGLFGEINNATIKNLKITGSESYIEGGDVAGVAGSATGTCVFENITITDSDIATYNNGCGGLIGWSGEGNYTFKDITIAEDVTLAGLWGSFDSSIGGVVGQGEPGATYNFNNVNIACRLDVYNDVTASYDYYNYRMCGMIIGRLEETLTIDGRNYPDMSRYNIICNNVDVTIGKWANYHYCRPQGGRGIRVEAGYAYGGIAANYDHSTCTVHHEECIPFDSLFGGAQYGVKGVDETALKLQNFDTSSLRVTDKAYTDRTAAEVYKYSDITGAATLIYVDSFATLQEAIDSIGANAGDYVIKVIKDIEEDVTVTQYPNQKITIAGDEDNKPVISGTIEIDGRSSNPAGAALTIENIVFDAAGAEGDALIKAGTSNATRYSNNVTISNCDFVDKAASKAVVAIKQYTGGCHNWLVTGCTATGMHSLIQVANVEEGFVIENCAITDCKNGINLNNTPATTITNTTADVAGYAVRIGQSDKPGTSALDYDMLVTLENNTFTSNSTEDALIIARGGAQTADFVISSGTYKNTAGNDVLALIEGSDAEITGGTYSSVVDIENIKDGYRLSRNASGYVVVPTNALTDSIYVLYEDVTPADATEEKVYGIVVKANDGDVINQLETVDLLFNLTGKALDDGEVTFTVRPADGFTMSQTGKEGEENRYMFNYSTLNGKWEGTAEAITVGYITVGGYGEYAISTNAEATTNLVNATTYEDNLVDYYTAAGATDNNTATGALFVNKDDNTTDKYVASVNSTIEVPTYALTVSIDFNNLVEKNAAAYQDMKVEIVGGVIDKELALGNTDYTETEKYPVTVKQTAKGYVLTANLPYNTSYAVTVSGAGYRTAYCDNIKLTEAKTVQFWNNVMSDKNALEVLVGSGKKVTKNFLAGEVVKDGEINIYDLSAVVSYFGQNTDKTAYSKYAKYDLNRDGVIDSKDVAYVLVSWNE